MRTVKQISQMTGISVRTLHYYDEIGLFKPSTVTDAGYRLYDDEALHVLRQILFFKELDFPLKDIQAILGNPSYDKSAVFRAQRKLIQTKRDRLNGLLSLLDQLIKGEENMSFAAFAMKEYTEALEAFVTNRADEINQAGGNLAEFQRILETLKSGDQPAAELAEMAAKQYGSMEAFTQAAKKNLARFPEIMEKMRSVEDGVQGHVEKSDVLMRRLTADLGKNPSNPEIQQIVEELVVIGSGYSAPLDMGENYWGLIAEGYLSKPAVIAVTDQKYGAGASAFIGSALRAYWNLGEGSLGGMTGKE